ncbi:hypothetical protein GG344DRAFT_81192 [Lentinula edodes]|nr:hypothetical protein GG344DRAFT_81192 [Lentinula edodes]
MARYVSYAVVSTQELYWPKTVSILGFSSGIVSTCAVASSNPAKSYLSQRFLGMWSSSEYDPEEAQGAISNSRSGNNSESEDLSELCITAVMDAHCVVVLLFLPIVLQVLFHPSLSIKRPSTLFTIRRPSPYLSHLCALVRSTSTGVSSNPSVALGYPPV